MYFLDVLTVHCHCMGTNKSAKHVLCAMEKGKLGLKQNEGIHFHFLFNYSTKTTRSPVNVSTFLNTDIMFTLY